MIRCNENDEPNKYGVTKRMSDIFEMAKKDIEPDESFTDEEIEYYKGCMIDFKNADRNGVSRERVVQWFNE